MNPIIRHIAAHGPVSIAEYMRLALSHPDWGYYTRRDPLGAAGDFTTAPEISQIFGEIIGAWLAGQWVDSSAPATLVELGPGRGTLMRDALRATRHVPGFHAALEVCMVEISPVLCAKQQETLVGAHPRISWRDSPLAPRPLPLYLIANEFFDALPVQQHIFTNGEWWERGVRAVGDGLEFTLLPPPLRGRAGVGGGGDSLWSLPPPSLPLPREGGGNYPEETIRESSPESIRIMAGIAAHIAIHGGAAVVVDYGYYRKGPHPNPLPQAGEGVYGDTLQAVKNHRYHPVLETPGEADITAHVDFSAMAEAARAAGCAARVLTQGEFLRENGAEIRAEMLCKNAGPVPKEVILSGLERLVSPTQMGELFKVLLVTPPLR